MCSRKDKVPLSFLGTRMDGSSSWIENLVVNIERAAALNLRTNALEDVLYTNVLEVRQSRKKPSGLDAMSAHRNMHLRWRQRYT